jgi:hypothetical protein
VQGAWEKDELRKDDSFATFEEVFQLAHSQNVSASAWSNLLLAFSCCFSYVSTLCARTRW